MTEQTLMLALMNEDSALMLLNIKAITIVYWTNECPLFEDVASW